MKCFILLFVITKAIVIGVLITFILSPPNIVYGQDVGPSKPAGSSASREAAALFNNVPTRLTFAEKDQIAKDLGFVLSTDKQQPFAQDAESLDYPFAARTLPTDMNQDGNEEIFVLYGNSFTSGATGASVVLFVKDAKGKYRINLGFPGLPGIMPALNGGYNDLLIGGTGFEFPVWRWNGREYTHYKTIRDSDLEKIRIREVEDLSSEYTSTLRK
ncbi:hypothetical protein GZH53_07415 [Flavihumibacter sp. R14]|nr:hypothetical protein [Flavihumibacter soli]